MSDRRHDSQHSVIEDVQRVITIVQAELSACEEIRGEAVDRSTPLGHHGSAESDSSTNFAEEAGFGASSPDCSSLQRELQLVQEDLTRAHRGELLLIQTPTEDLPPLVFLDNDPAAKARAALGATNASDRAAAYAGLAAALAGVAAGLALGGPLLAPAAAAYGAAAAALGAASAAEWLVSNAYQRAANDPPRQDYQIASKFVPGQFRFESPKSDFEATVQRFATQARLLSLAVGALVDSMERYAAVREIRKQYQSLGPVAGMIVKNRVRFEIAQTEAVAYNAAMGAQLNEELLSLKEGVNTAWSHFKEQLHNDIERLRAEGVSDPMFSPVEVRSKFAELWATQGLSLQNSLLMSKTDMEEITQKMDRVINAHDFKSDLPDILLNNQWTEIVQENTAMLRDLSAAYSAVSKALQES